MVGHVPMPFVTRFLGRSFDPDDLLVKRSVYCDGDYKDVGICQGCGGEIAAGKAVCDDCRKWSGVWARQAVMGTCGSVRRCLDELDELEGLLAGFSVVDPGSGGGTETVARLCGGCGCEVGPGVSLCERCEEELMITRGDIWL